MRGSAPVRILRGAGILVALGFLAITARSAWRELSVDAIEFHAGTSIASALLLAVTYLGMVALWQRLLADLGAATRYSQALQLWSFSNLGRYVPGKVWQLVGLVAFARDLRVSPGLATAAAVVAVGLMVGTGALASLVLAPGVVRDLGRLGPLVGVVAAGLLVPLIRPQVVSALLRRMPRALGCSEVAPLTRPVMARLVALFALAWAAHGAVFAVFASSFGSFAWGEGLRFAGAYALAYVVGLLAVFAPGGIGVREGVLGHLLGTVAPADFPVHVAAVASRLWAIAGELVVFGLAVLVRLRSRREAA